MPLASVVLPAPRLPINSTTPHGGNSCASRWPSAIVSSSDAVWYVGTRLRGGIHYGSGKVAQNIGGDQALLAQRARPQLPRQAMKVEGSGNRQVRLLGELRQQACDHTGENVACAAGAHGRRS